MIVPHVHRHLRAIRLLIAAGAAVALGVFWLNLWTSSYDAERAARERIEVAASVQVRAAADTVQASLDRFDVALQIASVAANAGADALAAQAGIVAAALPSDLVVQLFHIDGEGYLSYSSLGPAPRNYLGDRDYFRAVVANPDKLVVSNPVLGRLSNKWSVQIARAVRRDGAFAGAVVVAVSPETWMAQLTQYRHSPRDLLSLLGEDGHFLLRTLDSPSHFGRRVPHDRPFLQDRSRQEGVFVGTSPTDAVERLFSWIRLPSGLIMVSGIALEDALAPTRSFNRWALVRAGVSTALILLATGALLLALVRYENIVRALGEREEHFRKVVDNMAEGVMVIGADDRIVSVNPAFTAITGYAAVEVAGSTAHLLSPPNEDARNLGTLVAAHGATAWDEDFDGLRSNGETYTGHALSSAVADATGEGAHRIVLLTDVTERRRRDEEIWRQANFDLLTGLPNRSLMLDRLERMVSHARRSHSGVTVLFVDLDRFKPVNDCFGHDVGDLLLYQVARRLESLFREEDTVARIGGDEFVVLLPRHDEDRDAAQAAAKVVDSLSQTFTIDEQVLDISCCVGIARFPADGDSAGELLHHADLAMYRAKENGRSTWSA